MSWVSFNGMNPQNAPLKSNKRKLIFQLINSCYIHPTLIKTHLKVSFEVAMSNRSKLALFRSKQWAIKNLRRENILPKNEKRFLRNLSRGISFVNLRRTRSLKQLFTFKFNELGHFKWIWKKNKWSFIFSMKQRVIPNISDIFNEFQKLGCYLKTFSRKKFSRTIFWQIFSSALKLSTEIKHLMNENYESH